MTHAKQRSSIAYVGNCNVKVPGGTCVVSSDADYVKACLQLSEGATLSIWVRQKAHYTWLKSFAERGGLEVDFVELSPRTMLAERWRLSLPEWVDDETVTEQRLIEIDFGVSHPERFADAMLAVFAGKVFLAENAETAGIPQVIAAVTADETAQHFGAYPVLKRCLQEKCKAWAERSADAWVKDLCFRLTTDADSVWREMTLWAILAKYPGELLEYVLPAERVVVIRKVPVREVGTVSPHRVAAEQAGDQIEMFFTDMTSQVKTTADITKVVGCVSGLLVREFQLVERLLESVPCEPCATDLQRVREVFRGCPGVSAARLAALDRFVRPPLPSPADGRTQWSSDQWIRWSVGEYFPFRQWQVLNRKHDAATEATVQAFSDWYVREYAAIHQDPDKSLIHALTAHQNDILREQLSIVLVVDCLPATYVRLLQDGMQKAGFSQHALEYRFAPLPSHTSVSKPRLLSGQWELSGKGYPAIVAERAANEWNGKKAVYVQDLKALSELPCPVEPVVLVLNFLPSDETLHSDVEARNSSYEEELHRLFARLADSVQEFVGRWGGPMDQCGIYVVTDHGAARILDEERQTFDSKVVGRLFADEKHRFAAVPDTEAAGVPDNLWKLGYRFKQPYGLEPVSYFIPRGHNTVRMGGGVAGYVHGGATPEEVIVPALVYRPVKATRVLPAVRFSGLKQDSGTGKAIFYVQRLVTFAIVVRNPNREALAIQRIEVLTPDAEVKAFTPACIGEGEERNIPVSCLFNGSARGKEELVLRIAYEIAGDERAIELKTAAEFKSALTTGLNLKDLV